MKKIALALVALVAMAANASAAQINGSMSVGAAGAFRSLGSTNLLNTTTLSIVAASAGLSDGDYGVIPVGTPATVSILDLSNLAAFNITFGTFGTFQAAASIGSFTSMIEQRTANNLDVYLIGTYSGLPGFDDTTTSLRLSFTQTGNSVSASGTLASPPAPPRVVPEPTTFASALAAIALVGAIRLRRKSA